MEWFGTAMRPLSGGYSGETFLVGDGPDQVVLRIYQRSPERAVVDASLLRLVRGIVPVPNVVEVRVAEGEDPALLVTEFLPGTPLDVALADPTGGLDLAVIGRAVGEVLGRLSNIPFLHPGGFVGVDLDVSGPGWPDDLRGFAQGFRDTGRLGAWQDRDWDALADLIDQAGDVLDARTSRTVLVHSDANPKNLVVALDPSRVLGLVDWEFAHAGSPFTDLGNFTRFERDPRLVESLVGRLVDLAPEDLAEPVLPGRAADLWALVELAGGTPPNPVRELASELLLAQARAQDLQAWPFPGDRVGPRA